MNFFVLSRFFLIISVFAIAIVTPSTLFPFIVGKYAWFRTTIDFALIFFLLGLLFQDKLSVVSYQLSVTFKRPLIIAVTIFVVVFLLAGLLGVDPVRSFWSNFERGEGGIQMLHLYIFFLLLFVLFRDKKSWQKIFWVSVLSATLVVFYGLGAGLKSVDTEYVTREVNGIQIEEPTGRGGFFFETFKRFVGPAFDTSRENYRFQGSIGNPSYVATYMVFSAFYALYLLSTKYREKLKSFKAFVAMGAIVLFAVVFFLAATRGTFVGLLVATFFALLYAAFSRKKWRKHILVLGVLLFLIVGSLIAFKNTSFVKKLPSSRIFDISFSATSLQHRTFMWKTALDGWRERPILGWGPENYYRVFDKHITTKYYEPGKAFGAWFDRAHSIVFDRLIEAGILGLLSYLAIFIVFYVEFFRKMRLPAGRQGLSTDTKADQREFEKKKHKIAKNQHQSVFSNALIFAVPIVYFVQGQVLFEVLPIYIGLFFFLAFAGYKFYNEKPTTNS